MKRMFIVNPVAGRKKKRENLVEKIERICREESAEFAIVVWEKVGDIDDIIEQAKQGDFNVVIACGGDGTVHAIGTRLIGTGIALGIIPVGSGNGYSGHLGFSKNVDAAIRENLTNETVMVDTGEFGGVPFLNTAGVGMQATVAEKFASSKARGVKNYVRLGTQTFFKYKPEPVTVSVDGGRSIDLSNPLVVDIMNGTEWGAGAKIAPLSSIRDGKFTIVLLQKKNVVAIGSILVRLFMGNVHRSRHVLEIDGTKFSISREKPGIAQVDGDPIHLEKEISCEIIPESLKVLVPKGKSASF